MNIERMTFSFFAILTCLIAVIFGYAAGAFYQAGMTGYHVELVFAFVAALATGVLSWCALTSRPRQTDGQVDPLRKQCQTFRERL